MTEKKADKKKPLNIFIKREGKERRKLTLQIDDELFNRVDKKYNINYSYVIEQLLTHVDANGLDEVLPLRFVRPKKEQGKE